MSLQVFRASSTDDQAWAVPAGEEDSEVLLSLDGTPRAATWPRPRVEVVLEREDGQVATWTDFLFLGRFALVVRERAFSLLSEPLRPAGELLPLTCATEPLWLFNATLVIPALDLERSETRLTRSGQVKGVTQHVFKPELLADVLTFKLPELMALYMTGAFRSLVDELGLTGCGVQLVWSAEEGPVTLRRRRGDALGA